MQQCPGYDTLMRVVFRRLLIFDNLSWVIEADPALSAVQQGFSRPIRPTPDVCQAGVIDLDR